MTSDGWVEPCNGIEFASHDVLNHSLREALDSPFFRAVRELHPQDGRRCLVNTDPMAVLQVVESLGPSETPPGALAHLREHAGRARRASEGLSPQLQ